MLRHWWWKRHAAERQVLGLGALAVAVLALTTAAGAAYLNERHHDATALLAATRHRLEELRAIRPALPTKDFVSDLPEELRTEQVVRDATAWGSELGIAIPSLTVHQSPLVGRALQNATIHAELRGRYSEIKLWLRELLARYPELALVSLDLQRKIDAGASTLSASVQIRLYGKPKADPSAKGSR